MREPLAPRRRILLLAIAYGIYVLGAPGVLLPQGTPLAAAGLCFWALATSRPGRRAFWIEWLAGTVGFGSLITWMGYVFLPVLPLVMAGYGLYAAYGGVLMRRLAAKLPLAIATPLAWVGFESLLAWVPPPAGLSWLRLGHFLGDWPALAGSGRVWGVTGLGFALAGLAGLVADAWVRRSRPGLASWILGLSPAALGAILGILVPAPASESGPRLLLVQPSFEQRRKQITGKPEELFRETLERTVAGLTELERSGEPPPDLVCWGETMLPYRLAAEGLAEAAEGELHVDLWHPWGGLDAEARRREIAALAETEAAILTSLYGGTVEYVKSGRRREMTVERRLPEGTSFLAGVILFTADAGRLRRTNNVVLWDAQGNRAGVGGKVHLAPGGETMVGLERYQLVRDVIFDLANYVPDLLSVERPAVLELAGRDGRRWSFAATVCFDNAFTDVYAGPLREGPLDFHFIASNEAWYRRSQELDQMVAFSRLIALCTGRSVVRGTNSGVSLLVGPDGREVARLRVGGEDRMVPGTLAIRVPVPVPEARGTPTPFVRLEPWLLPGGALLPLLFLLLAAAGRVTRSAPGASGTRGEGRDRALDRP